MTSCFRSRIQLLSFLKLHTQAQLPSIRRALATEARGASPEHVRIVEVGPRDGLQNEPKLISLQTKLELISRLSNTGVTTIEAGSFVSPKWVSQVRTVFLAIT